MTGFPNRPDHPDFWLLAEVVQDADAVRDNKTQPFEDQTGAMVDLESLRYMAEQRALRGQTLIQQLGFLRNLTRQQQDMLTMWVSATWMDGFYAGARYQVRKERQQSEPQIPDYPEGP